MDNAGAVRIDVRAAVDDPNMLGKWGITVKQRLHPLTSAFARRLKAARVVGSYTQEEFSRALGINRDRYAIYELGISEPPFVLLGRIVKVTDKKDSELPPWQQVRASILNDMAYEARRSAKEQLFQEIVQGYEILVEEEVQKALEG